MFLMFGCLTLVALLSFWCIIPETKGRSVQSLNETSPGEGRLSA